MEIIFSRFLISSKLPRKEEEDPVAGTAALVSDAGREHDRPSAGFTRAQVLANAWRHWLIIDGLVLDVSDFIGVHPGGAELLLEYAGF
jgi:cytochrome b involved in lipid metabolism